MPLFREYAFLLSVIKSRPERPFFCVDTAFARTSQWSERNSFSGMSNAAADTTNGPNSGPYPASSIPTSIAIRFS